MPLLQPDIQNPMFCKNSNKNPEELSSPGCSSEIAAEDIQNKLRIAEGGKYAFDEWDLEEEYNLCIKNILSVPCLFSLLCWA